MRTDRLAGTDARTTSDGTDAGSPDGPAAQSIDGAVAESVDEPSAECDGAGSDDADSTPVSRAARLLRLLKLAATTLAALVGVAKALGWL